MRRATSACPLAQGESRRCRRSCTGECARTSSMGARARASSRCQHPSSSRRAGTGSLESETMMEHVFTTADRGGCAGSTATARLAPGEAARDSALLRVKPYLGGQYVGGALRLILADYFSGWNATELQHARQLRERERRRNARRLLLGRRADRSVAYLDVRRRPEEARRTQRARRRSWRSDVARAARRHADRWTAYSAEAVSGVSTLPRRALRRDHRGSRRRRGRRSPPPPRPACCRQSGRCKRRVPSPPAAAGASPSPSPPSGGGRLQDEGIGTAGDRPPRPSRRRPHRDSRRGLRSSRSDRMDDEPRPRRRACD